uniref:Embryo defective n=1 Tax=Tanacetum cinerariifolium TaxID=118510 RepID=A0A699IIS5_TANCI|nr:embryo defective [Tanacetum cinerariifolium]
MYSIKTFLFVHAPVNDCEHELQAVGQDGQSLKEFNHRHEKESLQVHIWQHVMYYRNLDYKEEAKRIWNYLQEWIGDKCLDFVESMWSYRGMVGFIKFVKIV